MIAARRANKEAVTLQLAHKANLKARSRDGMTVLHLGMIYGKKHLVKLLLDKGLDLAAAKGNKPLAARLRKAMQRTGAK